MLDGMADLSGKTVAFLVASEGIERVELTQPWEAVKTAGATPVLVSPESGDVRRTAQGRRVGTVSKRPCVPLVERATRERRDVIR